ncbi:MAG: D-alanyl-D-alanine carboxypeptidase family protein [Acidimicrobiales bacterium]
MSHRSRTARAVLIALLWLVTAALPSAGAQAEAGDEPNTDLAQSQETLRQEQADVASQLDVLRADSEQVGSALATVEANVRSQQHAAAAAMAAAEQARINEAKAVAQVEATTAEVERLKLRVEKLAVDLYLRPPANDAVQAFIRASPGEAPRGLALVRFRVEDVADTMVQAEAARDRLAADRIRAGEARQAAERTAEAEAARLGALQVARDQQQVFAAEVAGRIERALGEAAMLSDLDAELSAEVQRRELALAAQLTASVAHTGTAIVVLGDGEESDAPTSGDGASTDTVPTTPTSDPTTPSEGTGPTPTTPPSSGGAGGGAGVSGGGSVGSAPVIPRAVVVVPVDTTWIRGIEVASAIAEPFEALMAAAEEDGIHLGGSGYRNVLRQIELRRDHCGPTEYDIWLKPSWECSPPVARPGNSMHEKGLAIDFAVDVGTEDEDLIRTRDHPAFAWLSAYNRRTGFLRNLDSEPWHWSPTGQ